jgi:protein-S-isoprenylcysteine O-methyltransferase Ste14
MHSSEPPANPGVPFPPPLLYVGGFLGGLAIERWGRRIPLVVGDVRIMLVLAGWAAVGGGLAFASWGMGTFWRARTAIVPIHPATLLVSSGPYRFSRNPMYVGLAALYLGLACVFNVTWPLVLFPVVLATLYRVVIRREERYLAGAFGAEYASYRRRVRRWL